MTKAQSVFIGVLYVMASMEFADMASDFAVVIPIWVRLLIILFGSPAVAVFFYKTLND